MSTFTQVSALTDFTPNTLIQSALIDANFAAIRSVVNALITGSNAINADTIAEVTSAGGVTIDGVLLKDGGAFLGDTSNANVTLGLTINQGAADDHILALKSSDVATGLTTAVGGQDVETDDFLCIQKESATLGGVRFKALGEDNASLSAVLTFEAYGGQADPTKSTAGRALVEFLAYEHNGSNALANVTADGNVFGIRALVGGSELTRWLVDEDGDTWQAGGAVLGGANGIDVNPGSDIDVDLITVGVTGAPRLYWDETSDRFRLTKAVHAEAGTSVFTNVSVSSSGGTFSVGWGGGTMTLNLGLETGDTIGFHGAAGATQQTITGSRGGNAALADLLTKMATKGLIVDGTSA